MNWDDVQIVFAEATERPPGVREAWLETRCAGAPGLRDQVQRLLDSHEHAGDFLGLEVTADRPSDPRADLLGLRIGPFRLVREVGRGGMSVVYLAERVEGDFRQRVAVKVIDAPIRREDVLNRYRAERQILANFAHPHIVSLLDAGVIPDGRPYLMMEFVEGQPLARYCSGAHLALDGRAALIQQVLSAVQYAHQHGVVHRDLKPANILVTADGVVKVLDFGIAKLLDDSIVDGAGQTHAGAVRALTPNYASPEQWRGLPVTTATDIYALGVLLYETFAGVRPYDAETKPLDEVLKQVLERDPVRPSLAARRADLPYPSRRLEGDLDAIVLKAMHKAPEARYASARELGDDLTRHARGEPIEARPPSVGYLLRGIARRHKPTVAVAAVALVALIGTLAGLAWQMRIVRAERDRANQRFADARQLANALIYKIHDGVAPLAGSTPVRQLIVAEALTYLERLSQDPAGDEALRLDLARGYKRIADVQGLPGSANLGDRAGARASYERGAALLRPMLAGPLARDAALELGRTDLSLATVLSLTTETAAAQAAVAEAADLAEKLVARNGADADARRLRASALFHAALIAERPAALERWKQAGAAFDALLAEKPEDPDRQRNVALVEKYIGSYYEGERAFADALPHFARALALDEQRLAANPANRAAQFDVAVDLSGVAFATHRTGHTDDAVAAFRRALSIREALVASDPNDVQARNRVALTHKRLAAVLLDQGRHADAIDHLRKAVALDKDMQSVDAGYRAEYANSLAQLAIAEGKAGDGAACGHFRQADAVLAALDKEALHPDIRKNVTEGRDSIRAPLATCVREDGGR